jgi:hypothetical protein
VLASAGLSLLRANKKADRQDARRSSQAGSLFSNWNALNGQYYLNGKSA